MKHDPGMVPPPELIDTLRSAKRLVGVGHVTPDADCLGSLLAFARVWSQGGGGKCDVRVSLPDGAVSRRLAFMVEEAGVLSAGADDFAAAEGFVVMDSAQLNRCCTPPEVGAGWPAGRPVINVDHHITNTCFGDVNWIVGTAASTCELVFEIIKAAGKEVDPVSASLLYAGIYTDTVGFSLSRTTGDTLRTAAELVEHGARVGRVCERLDRSQGDSQFRLLKTIYHNTRLAEDDRIAYSTASYDEIVAAGCAACDIDDQVYVPRSLAGIKMAILFTEGHQGITRLNFRGEQGMTVVDLARSFDGGGHAEAAGATLSCTVEEAVARVIPAAIEALRRQDGDGARGQ